MHDYRVDLYTGQKNLVAAWEKNQDRSISVRFEDMVAAPESTWERIFSYLDMQFDPSCLLDFSKVKLAGRMGDPTGRKEFKKVSTKPLGRWTHTMGNPLRRRWCRAYLRFLGEETLAVMGYSSDELLQQLEDTPKSYDRLAEDLWRQPFGWAVTWFDLRILKSKLQKIGSCKIHAFG